MAAKFILAVFAALFLIAAGSRLAWKGRIDPASKAWLLVGVIFVLVAGWLWLSQP